MAMMTPVKGNVENTGNVFIRISDGKNKIYNYRYDLRQSGFDFNKRSGSNSFYELKTTEDKSDEWAAFAKSRKLQCNIIPAQYTRSSDYRKDFFKTAKPAIAAKYRCAYCGRVFTYQQITVDHIIPVNQMQYSVKARKLAKRFGIENVNDVKNLVAACRSCNSRKSIKMGMWVYRGFLGKSERLWKIRKGIKTICISAVILFLFNMIVKYTDFNSYIAAKLILMK